MNLSQNIKKIRKENNLSQEQLAEKLGVSRQSVSKWESGQAYPEMDKVLQICDLFNLNMDELMKSDIKEVRERKQSSANINKFIDDFFGFITKTIDMFSAMKFKEKIKCFIEQILIALALFLIFFTAGAFGEEIFRRIFGFINNDFYWILLNIFDAIYLIIATILFMAIFLHTFKVRYLDYYIIMKEDNNTQENDYNIQSHEEDIDVKINKIELSKKQEKIIIRDPNHSGYKFLNGLLKCAIFLVKVIMFFMGLGFIFTLFLFGFMLVVPFLIMKAGFFFWGMIICIISCIIINLVILKLIYNFLLSKKSKKSLMGIIVAFSVLFLGIGGGIFALGLPNLKYVENISSKELITTTFEIEMNDKLILDIDYYKNDIEYIESNTQEIIVEVSHSKFVDVTTYDYGSTYIGLTYYPSDYKVFAAIKAYLEDLNNYEIKDRQLIKTKVYGSKENLDIIKKNKEENYNLEANYQRQIEDLRNYYESQINELYERINKLESNY